MYAQYADGFTTPQKVIPKDLPEDWTCPECGVGKEDFEPED